MGAYDTWPCLPKSYWEDTDETPDPDFTLLLEGSYFTLFVSGNTFYGTVVPPASNPNGFYCRVYSDSDRTIEVTAGDYTGQPYRMEFFGGWTFENRNRFGERDFSGAGRWKSNPVVIYGPGGRAEGFWIVEDYTEGRSAVYFSGNWVPNTLGILGLTLTEGTGGTLAAGTYTVHVSGVDASAREGGASWEQITVSANATINVSWRLHPDAVSYNIYLNCALKKSGETGPTYIIGDSTLEDPGKTPPKDSDPDIPVNPDDPVVIITPPDNPDGDLPGGKVIVTDPGTDNDIVIEYTPMVPIDPSIQDKVIETRTEQVGDCLETKVYVDGSLESWTKLCTNPIDGSQTFCVGEKEGDGAPVNTPIDQVFPGVLYPMLTTAEQDEIFTYSLVGGPLIPLSYPISLEANVIYVDDQGNPIDPNANASEGQITVTSLITPQNSVSVGDQESVPWEQNPTMFNLEATNNGIRIESISTGDPTLLPGVEWYLLVVVPGETWNFVCSDVNPGEVTAPTVGACRSVTTFFNQFEIGGVTLGDRLTSVQCNSNPLNSNWVDTSVWSDILLSFFGLNVPYPRVSTRQERIPNRTRQDLHDPRLWTFPLGNEDPRRTLESLWLVGRLNGVNIPTGIKKTSTFFNKGPGA